MAATITSTANRITISGNYKAFTSTTGSTSTVIQYNTGDAPASGDAGRFLMWKNNTSNSDTWEIRYIESATATTVTVGDGGFSSAPGTGETFAISTNLADINTAEPVACTVSGLAYSFNGRDWGLTSSAFLAEVDVSLDTEQAVTTSGYNAWNAANGCAVQFGRLTGGEANGSTITRQGCYISLNSTKTSANSNVFGSGGSEVSNGPIFNFYGCYIKNYTPTVAAWAFMRGSGPVRMIGSIWDGPIGGAFYHSASELVDTKFRGNTNLTPAWSIRATFTRDISNAQFSNGLAAFKTFQAYTGIFRDTIFDLDSLTDVVFVDGNNVAGGATLVDCTTFGDAYINDSGNGFIYQGKSINYTLADSSGTGLTGAKVAVYDVDGTIQDAIEASTSGSVAEIVAISSKWTTASPSLDKSPFDIRIRKYDYQYQDFQSAVSEPIKQEFRLPSNTVTVLSEAAAAALTGIAIDFVAETVTLTSSKTLSEIYDYIQSQLALDANMDEVEFFKSADGNVFTLNDNWQLILNASGAITGATGKTLVFGGTGKMSLNDAANTIDNLTVTGDIDLGALVTPLTVITAGVVDFSVAGTYVLDACTFTEVTNSSGGSVTADLINGATVTTNTGPSITLSSPVDITAPNLVDDSRVQIYNVTKAAEIDNSVVSGGSGYSLTVNLAGASVDNGDAIRMRVTYQSGVVAMAELEASGVVTASGLSFVNTQTSNAVYDAYGLDGSTVTEFSFDSGNIEIDINDLDNTTEIQRIAAWEVYFETTEQGIRDFFGCINWESLNSVKIEVSMCDLKLDNSKTSPLLVTGGRIYRSDGATVVSATSNSIQIDYEPVYIGNADDITEMKATIDTNLDVVLSTRSTQTSVDGLPASVPSVPDIVAGVFDEIT